MGQLAEGRVTLVETVEDARRFAPREPSQIAYLTQTTLSLDDTADIIAVLQQRFPAIVGSPKKDICYATTNRQAAVKAIARRAERVLVVGAPNSSNSRRLVEVAERAGCPAALLVQRAADIPWDRLLGASTIGVTAGASAPELLVEEIIEAFRHRFAVTIDEVVIGEERVAFNVPRELRGPSAQ
jgi:4-hydroxy-3-methylbut-2-enyl diphosphate reductase